MEQFVSEGAAIMFVKENYKTLSYINLDICIFTQGLNVKQFFIIVFIILVFILDSFLA